MQSVFDKLAFCFSWFAVVAMAITVGLIPWILGGVVPAALFVLLIGSILAASFTTLFQLCTRSTGDGLPKVLAPVLGLAIIGFWQLAPATTPAAGVLSESFETYLNAAPDALTQSRSFSPADTRTRTAVYLSLALLSVSAFQSTRTPAKIAFIGLSVVLNGLAVGAVGISLQFRGQSFPWNDIWELKSTGAANARGFAAFINPNGAGGWLCLAFAVTTGLVHWQMQKKSTDPKLRRGRLRISWFGKTWQRTLEFLAELTVWQILSIAALAFLAAAVAATKSRGAIAALVGAVAISAAMKSSFKALPFVLALIMATAGLSYALLQSLELSEDISSEIDTIRDLETAIGARPQHWQDALNAWTYFPWLGSGHGSYRFATAPFSTTYHGVWFRNADNQYIETLVEAGIVGLIFFISIGWIGIKTASAASRQAKVRHRQKEKHLSRPSRRLLTGLGTAITVAILTQGIAASVDFGVAMAPASALLILMIASVSGFLNTSPNSEPSKLAGTIQCSKVFSICISTMLIVATAGFLKDQWHAISVDEQVVAGHRRLQHPVSAADLGQLKKLKLSLTDALKNRPDDPEGLRMLSRLVVAEFRWQTLLLATDGAIASDERLSRKWRQWNLHFITNTLQQAEKSDSDEAQQLRTSLNNLMDSQQVSETLRSIQLRFPHLLGVPDQRAIFAAIAEDEQTFQRQAMLSQTLDPSNAKKLFALGLTASNLGLSETAVELWKQSLRFSNRFRWAVLTEAAAVSSLSDAMQDFGPESYHDCLATVQRVQSADLKEALWQRAEQQWMELEQPISESTCQLRIRHLKSTQRSDEVFAFVESALIDHPDSVKLRTELAQQLEGQELFRRALDEWQRVLFLDPKNQLARKSLSRLKSLK